MSAVLHQTRDTARLLDCIEAFSERIGARSHDGRTLVAVVPRLVWPLLRHEARPLPRGRGATRLRLPETIGHGRTLVNVMSGAELEVPSDNHVQAEQLLADFPVALLVSQVAASEGPG